MTDHQDKFDLICQLMRANNPKRPSIKPESYAKICQAIGVDPLKNQVSIIVDSETGHPLARPVASGGLGLAIFPDVPSILEFARVGMPGMPDGYDTTNTSPIPLRICVDGDEEDILRAMREVEGTFTVKKTEDDDDGRTMTYTLHNIRGHFPQRNPFGPNIIGDA